MSYQRLLLEYATPLTRWQDPQSSAIEKRLRWEKNEAMGNSKFRWTGIKARYAHIANRNLQSALDRNVSVWARTHGNRCREIEVMQRDLWESDLHRYDGCSRLSRRNTSRKNSVYPGDYRTSEVSTAAPRRPYTTASDYFVYKKSVDKMEETMLERNATTAPVHSLDRTRFNLGSVKGRQASRSSIRKAPLPISSAPPGKHDSFRINTDSVPR